MKQKFLSIVNFGIKPGTPPDIAEQMQLVNGISSTGIPICLTYILIFSLTGFYPLVLAFSAGVVIFALPLFLNKWFGLNPARLFVNIFASILFGTVSVLSGKDAGFYLGFLVISVPPILVFPSIRTALIFIIYCISCMLASIAGNIYIAPVCDIPFSMALYLFNLFTVLFATLTVVFIFKVQLSESKAILSEKNKEIVDSINYARKIQYTLLAHDELLQKNLNEHFILFKPKSIVSGDFYWATKFSGSEVTRNHKQETINQELFYLAVCDSTGHGVPGAFMSLLNISFLNEAITEKNILEPHAIFNHARTRLIENLGKDGQKDGFDGILICFNKSNNTIIYSAANNSPILFSNNIIIELEKDKMPVGVGEKSEEFK
ncbi:MAG TPA: SpoIIE family protein phosphatase, partial [Bacteroidia bacterium]|nr:SpoIIE family protein phosphatase [Bacteroidia bacterium]